MDLRIAFTHPGRSRDRRSEVTQLRVARTGRLQ